MAKHAASRTLVRARKHTGARRVMFTISVVAAIALLVLYAIWFAQNARTLGSPRFALSVAVLALLVADAAGCLALVVFDYTTYDKHMRIIARVTLACLVATVAISFMTQGFQIYQLTFLYLFFSITAFQALTDDQLARNAQFRAPWDMSEDDQRRDYIPLNFFNIFWVFVVASVIGLGVEVVFRAITEGVFESRAGLLWGPFSPIYGVGAVLMTIVLNRYWNRSLILIFLVSGLIGAGFEWFASFFWETAFGIRMWSYPDGFLNVDGRTDLAHALAWGALGLMWIRVILPSLLRMVDSIPLRSRAIVTTLFALFVVVDCIMTVAALDAWYERASGVGPSDFVGEYCAQRYDDAFMERRFETMRMDPGAAQRGILPG